MIAALQTAALLLLAAPQGAADAAPAQLALQRYRVDPTRSSIGFEGESTLHDFSGKAGQLAGELRVEPEALSATAGGAIVVQARSLDTGSGKRDKNMREDLDVEHHPTIRFEIDALEGALDGWSGEVRARGRFLIHGVERERVFPVRFEPLGNGFRVQGSCTFDMSDHGIDPHSVLFVSVHDEVEVVFDVVATPVSARRLPADVRELTVVETFEPVDGPARTSTRHDRLWSRDGALLWESPGRAEWILADAGEVAAVDAADARRLPAAGPAERLFDPARRRLAQLPSRPDFERERAALERGLALAPAAGAASVERAEGRAAVRLGEVEYVAAEDLEGDAPFLGLLLAAEGVPAAVRAELGGLRGLPASARVREVTPEGVRTLELRLGEARPGQLPEWALRTQSWLRADEERHSQ